MAALHSVQHPRRFSGSDGSEQPLHSQQMSPHQNSTLDPVLSVYRMSYSCMYDNHRPPSHPHVLYKEQIRCVNCSRLAQSEFNPAIRGAMSVLVPEHKTPDSAPRPVPFRLFGHRGYWEHGGRDTRRDFLVSVQSPTVSAFLSVRTALRRIVRFQLISLRSAAEENRGNVPPESDGRPDEDPLEVPSATG